MKENLIKRITINPNVCFGKPAIRISRYTVEMVLDLLAAGMTNEEIIVDYPAIDNDDIKACLQFAAKLMSVKSISKVIAA